MLQRFALLLALLVICLVAFAWLQAESPLAPASSGPNGAEIATTSAAHAATKQSQVPAVVADRSELGGDAIASLRAIDPDAKWVELTVVDVDGNPVPGATVSWYDEQAEPLLAERRDLLQYERNQIYRQPMLLAQHFGWSGVSDAQGKAKVTVKRRTWIAGKHADRFGRMQLESGMQVPSGGHRLVLLPDATMRVLVVDDQEQPVAGVWLTLAVTDPEGEDIGSFESQPMNRTDEHGIAEFPHYQQWRRILADDASTELLSPRASVRIFFSHSEDAGAILDLATVPVEPIVLHMRPTGTVRARVDIPGQTFAPHYEIMLCSDGSRFSDYLVARLGDDGWAHFSHVPIGLRYRLHSLAASGIWQQFDGPGQPGDNVDVVLRPSATAILLRARVVDEHGDAIANQRFQVELQGEGLRRRVQFETDHNGQLLTLLDSNSAARSAQLQSGIVTPYRGHLGLGTAALAARLLHPGINDLGDVVLRRGQLLVAGELLVGSEPYRGQVFPWLEKHTPPTEQESESWHAYQEGVSASVDADGHFQVCGELEAGTYRIQFYAPELQPVAPVPLEIGNTSMHVQVTPGYAIVATYLLPENADPSELVYRLRPCDGRAVDAPLKDLLEDAYPERREGEQCMIAWWGLPPGEYTLEIAFWTDSKPLVNIPSIAVPLPSAGDVRLADIDLRNLVQVVTIKTVDKENRPLDCDGALFSAQEVAAGTWRGSSFSGAAMRLLLPSGAVDHVLAAEGYQRSYVRGTGSTFVVTMHPWPDVQIRVADVPQLPDGVTCYAGLRAMQPVEGRWHDRDYQERLQTLLGVDDSQEAVVDGMVQLPIGEGAYKLILRLHDDRTNVPLVGATPSSILWTSDIIEVRASASSWEAAIAAFRK